MEETKTELQLIKLSEIQSQEVSWLWFPFNPYGKLTIVQGDPGDGKTTFVLNIAAKLTKGEGLDGEMKLTEPLNVIYQSAEDGNPPAGRKGTFDKAERVESAFALLSGCFRESNKAEAKKLHFAPIRRSKISGTNI